MKPPAAENMSPLTLLVVCVLGAACWAFVFWLVWLVWRFIQG